MSFTITINHNDVSVSVNIENLQVVTNSIMRPRDPGRLKERAAQELGRRPEDTKHNREGL